MPLECIIHSKTFMNKQLIIQYKALLLKVLTISCENTDNAAVSSRAWGRVRRETRVFVGH